MRISFLPLYAVDFEMWHLELIIGLVVLISSCRFLLLKTWTDFAESSEAANQQVNQVTVAEMCFKAPKIWLKDYSNMR